MSYYSKWFDFKSSLGKSGESSDCAGLRLLANIMADEMKGACQKLLIMSPHAIDLNQFLRF